MSDVQKPINPDLSMFESGPEIQKVSCEEHNPSVRLICRVAFMQ